jgi:hypothetical protein
MAMNDDTDYPRLTPPDDRYQSPGNLFRSANDLTDDQFDLLAAAWSENALPDDSLAEMEALFVSDPGKKAYAGNFRQLRLAPYKDEWNGINALLRTTPAAKIIRRAYLVTMAAAAVILVLLTLKPFAGDQPVITAPVSPPEVAMVSEPAETAPLVVQEDVPGLVVAVTETSVTAEIEEPPVTEREQTVKATPVRVNARTEAPVITPGVEARELLAVNFNEIPASLNIPEKEENWLVKGITGLAKATKKEKTQVDGYIIAKSCIKGINSVFGADIELEKVISEEGDTVSVIFNSSLLSFSAPVKKSSQ